MQTDTWHLLLFPTQVISWHHRKDVKRRLVIEVTHAAGTIDIVPCVTADIDMFPT